MRHRRSDGCGEAPFINFNGPEESDLSRLASNLKDGLSNGAIWALIALGYTLVYGIIQLINFAHGELFMIGSFTAVTLYGTFGLTPATAAIGLFFGLLAVLVVTMITCGILNAMIERVGYRPLRHAPKLAPLITAVGFSFILQNVGILWLGPAQQAAPDLIQLAEGALRHRRRRRSRRATSSRSPRPSRCCSFSARSSRAAGWARPCARLPRIPRPRG